MTIEHSVPRYRPLLPDEATVTAGTMNLPRLPTNPRDGEAEPEAEAQWNIEKTRIQELRHELNFRLARVKQAGEKAYTASQTLCAQRQGALFREYLGRTAQLQNGAWETVGKEDKSEDSEWFIWGPEGAGKTAPAP